MEVRWDTHGLGDSRDGLFPRQDAHIFSILDQSVVLTTSEVRERLCRRDIRPVHQSLDKQRDIADGTCWVCTPNDVVCEQSCNCNSLVAVFDSRTFGSVTWYGRESFVGRGQYGNVGGSGESLCETVYETDKLEQGAEIWLRGKKRCDVALGQATAGHQQGRPE
jgi:hypothetical protein